MLDKLILEKVSLWDYLKTSNKPICLYGMGDGALKIYSQLKKRGIEISGIFASDEFVRGHSFLGFEVKTLKRTKEELGEFITLLSFASQREPLLSSLYKMSEEYEFYAPDVPVVKTDENVFDIDYAYKNKDNLLKVYNLLADDLSKEVFRNVLNFKISGKVSYLKGISTDISEVYEKLICPSDKEDYVDLGAYNGDTVLEFLSHAKGANSIYAFEPDKKNFKKLKKTVEQNGIDANIYNIGVYSKKDTLYFDDNGGRNSHLKENGKTAVEVNSVDNILNGNKASVIKFDVEGAECDAIKGAEHTIKTYKPRLMVSAYHKNEDLFSLPLQILALNSDYKVYLRHHPYIPAWETNYYFV